MTTERWNDTMLDRLADRAASNLEQIEQNTHNIELLIDAINGLISRGDEDRRIIREMQTEIRGMQTENRRIWEEMQNHRRDGHGA